MQTFFISRMFNMKTQLFAAAVLAAASVSAQAAAISAPLSSLFTNAVVIDFESFDGLVNTTGSVSLGQGVTFSGALDAELAPTSRDLGDNGLWGINRFAASGSDSTMTFSFESLQHGVGAFVSHNGGAALLVEALGLGGNVLESYTVSFVAPTGVDGYNEGTYVGFSRALTDIQALRITGAGAVADDVSAVPEPESYALGLIGLGLLGAIARRRQTA
jgi:MYXO-CTERM domain-containing protein